MVDSFVLLNDGSHLLLNDNTHVLLNSTITTSITGKTKKKLRVRQTIVPLQKIIDIRGSYRLPLEDEDFTITASIIDGKEVKLKYHGLKGIIPLGFKIVGGISDKVIGENIQLSGKIMKGIKESVKMKGKVDFKNARKKLFDFILSKYFSK